MRGDLGGYDGEIWAETKALRALTDAEYQRVRSKIVAALSKHGGVYDECDGEHDFFVYDDMFFDRTQKIEVEITERLASILVPAVAAVQQSLKKAPLWRIMFIGNGHEAQSQEEYFLVYPDVVRFRQMEPNKSVEQALVENAQLRLRHLHQREEHQIQRQADLRKALVPAISQMTRSQAPVVLVAWFATLGRLGTSLGWEGKPGTSVWFLLREPLPKDTEGLVESDVKYSFRWTSATGSPIAWEQSSELCWQLLHFEDSEALRSRLAFELRGKHFKFAQPLPR